MSPRSTLNLTKWLQSTQYGGAEFALGSAYSALQTCEDLGPSTATTAAELATVLGNRASASLLHQVSSIGARYELTEKASPWLHPGDYAQRLLLNTAPYTAGPVASADTFVRPLPSSWPLLSQSTILEGAPASVLDLSPQLPTMALGAALADGWVYGTSNPSSQLDAVAQLNEISPASPLNPYRHQSAAAAAQSANTSVGRVRSQPWPSLAYPALGGRPHLVVVAPSLTTLSLSQDPLALATQPIVSSAGFLSQPYLALFPLLVGGGRPTHLSLLRVDLAAKASPTPATQPNLPIGFLPTPDIQRPVRTGLGKALDPA